METCFHGSHPIFMAAGNALLYLAHILNGTLLKKEYLKDLFWDLTYTNATY
jgi:hypothetical protein